MDSSRWRQVKELFHAVRDVPEAERADFLRRRCGEDAELREELESLLRHSDESFLSASPMEAILDPDEATPARLGPYRILREIGRGGMGAVYLAEREDEYRQRVAVKLVRAGMDSREMLQRFRYERQLLAYVEHPHIARLLDGGADHRRRPYFVMEYVEGQPLTDYCDQRRLTVEQRIRLFLDVCAAVSHAHARLIVHRDLKPGNILVTAEGVVKLLDFGLGRILEPEAVRDATITAWRMMTPAYVSPEHILGQPAAVSGDVYSLGLILYELLAGRRAYEVNPSSPLEAARVICEMEPPAPSQAVQEMGEAARAMAGQRRLSPERLARLLRGDLGRIVLKALRKDPARRYASVEQFSGDLRRFLAGRAVTARPDSLAYRTRRFVARNRVPVAISVLAAAALVAGLVAALWQARRAQHRFDEVHQLANSVVFEMYDQIAKLPGSTSARELLVQRALRYLDSLSAEAAGDAALQRDAGLAYARLAEVQGVANDANLGDREGAARAFARAVPLLEAYMSARPADREVRRRLATVQTEWAELRQSVSEGRDGTALPLVLRAFRFWESEAAAHPGDPGAQLDLARGYFSLAIEFTAEGKMEAALPEYGKALAIYRQAAARDPSNLEVQRAVALSQKRRGAIFGRLKRYPEAMAAYEEARVIDTARIAAQPDEPQRWLDLSYDLGDLGWVHCHLKDHAGERDRYRECAALREKAALADPRDARARDSVESALGRLSRAHAHTGDYEAARIPRLRQIEMIRRRVAERPTREARAGLASAELELGRGFRKTHNCAAAAPWLRESRTILEEMEARRQLTDDDRADLADVRAQQAKCGSLANSLRPKPEKIRIY